MLGLFVKDVICECVNECVWVLVMMMVNVLSAGEKTSETFRATAASAKLKVNVEDLCEGVVIEKGDLRLLMYNVWFGDVV